jgi:hypothetical protein
LAAVDILAPSDRRCIWSAEEKAALLVEIGAEGGKVRLVARRHQISESLLYNWRSARKSAAVALGAPENVEFMPGRCHRGSGDMPPDDAGAANSRAGAAVSAC